MTTTLGHRVRSGLAWSSASNLLLRIGSLAVGIVLARLLAPEQFGVYAVALTVQSILMTLADPGLSAVLIRAEDPESLAPTAATMGLASGVALAAVTLLSAPAVAAVMGAPEAGPIIAVLSVTLALAGTGIVPLAALQRSFAQQKIFVAAAADFAVSTTATLLLVTAGAGPMALAVGRVLGQAANTALQFALARTRPSFGWNRDQLRLVVSFGAPLAGANLVSWIVINVDNVVIARTLGPVALGFYVLAFNIASWPMNALGQAVRAVALPGFSQSFNAPQALRRAAALTWAGASGAGALLGVLAVPLIAVVYGRVWLPSAPVLAALAIFGAMRAVFDLGAGYLMAVGRSKSVLALQMMWGILLVPGLLIGIGLDGVAGAGWAHAAVGVVVLAAYVLALRAAGAPGIVRGWVVPSLLSALAAAVAWFASGAGGSAVMRLVIGAAVGTGILAAGLAPWVRRELKGGQARVEHRKEPPVEEKLPEGRKA